MPVNKEISFLSEPVITPVLRNYYENWRIRSFHLEHFGTNNYLSPNRRDFFKVLLISKSNGKYTLGNKTYYLTQPTILFIPPTEIISWKSMADHFVADYCLFKKAFVDEQPGLKLFINKYRVFNDHDKRVITLTNDKATVLSGLFNQMQENEGLPGSLETDAMQAFLQLIIIESLKQKSFPEASVVTGEDKHIQQFFKLLEQETADINYTNPIRIRTAKEFADDLSISPNYLNALLKKHTGQNVSTHIKNRLLDESKALLLQTDWTLQDIANAVGFADQPNFSASFKKATGFTPTDFRKKYNS